MCLEYERKMRKIKKKKSIVCCWRCGMCSDASLSRCDCGVIDCLGWCQSPWLLMSPHFRLHPNAKNIYNTSSLFFLLHYTAHCAGHDARFRFKEWENKYYVSNDNLLRWNRTHTYSENAIDFVRSIFHKLNFINEIRSSFINLSFMDACLVCNLPNGKRMHAKQPQHNQIEEKNQSQT